MRVELRDSCSARVQAPDWHFVRLETQDFRFARVETRDSRFAREEDEIRVSREQRHGFVFRDRRVSFRKDASSLFKRLSKAPRCQSVGFSRVRHVSVVMITVIRQHH